MTSLLIATQMWITQLLWSMNETADTNQLMQGQPQCSMQSVGTPGKITRLSIHLFNKEQFDTAYLWCTPFHDEQIGSLDSNKYLDSDLFGLLP